MILNQVIAALIAAFDAVVTVPVIDGPRTDAVNNRQFVVVGSDGDEASDGATVILTPSDLGPGHWVDEQGEVLCSSWAWSGGDDIATRRAEALALADACVAAVHADRTLSGLLDGPGRATVSEVRYRASQTDGGPLCRFTFTVSYRALLTT